MKVLINGTEVQFIRRKIKGSSSYALQLSFCNKGQGHKLCKKVFNILSSELTGLCTRLELYEPGVTEVSCHVIEVLHGHRSRVLCYLVRAKMNVAMTR